MNASEPSRLSLRCPDCPLCGRSPIFFFETQAFCGTDACEVLMWDPTKTAADNLAHRADIDLSSE